MSNLDEHIASMRRTNFEAKKKAMQEGRIQRASTFKAKKGKGSYKRKSKYGKEI